MRRRRIRKSIIVLAILVIVGVSAYTAWERRQLAITWLWEKKEQFFPTPVFSHSQVLAELERVSQELTVAIDAQEVDSLRCQRLISVTMRQANRMLERPDIQPSHKDRADYLLLQALTIGCEINPLRFRRRWNEHCDRLLRAEPDSKAAAAAAAHQLAYRHMKQDDAPLPNVLNELRLHVKRYPSNEFNVQLFLGVANRRVELGRPDEAAMIIRAGMRCCATLPGANRLQSRMAELGRQLR